MEPPTDNVKPNMPDDWKSHQLLVLSTMSRLELKTDACLEKIEAVRERQHRQDKDIDRLKTKASILGVVFGSLSGIAVKYFGG